MKEKSLKKNFIYNFLYQILAIIVPLITSPYLARTLGAKNIGIASWTKHPKESKNLLMLVNTDKELANLICFGEEGKDYSLKNGKVVGEKHVSNYCPAKLANTKFSIYEANGEKDKAKYYYDGNKEYSMSPAAGFVPNKKVVEKNKKILNEVDVFYQKLLESDEEPEKMIDQYMRNLESDLGKVKAETASVMAEETRAKRELDECTEQVNKMQSYAEKALTAGNEADARKFLEKKQQLVSTQTALQQSYEAAAANAAKMRQMHDKLVKDIESLESRKAAIKAKVATAKAQERLNSIGSSVTGANNSMAAFSKMEAKANKMLDEANAMAELNQSQEDSDIDNLAAKYDSAPQDAAVDDELAALKAKMGL